MTLINLTLNYSMLRDKYIYIHYFLSKGFVDAYKIFTVANKIRPPTINVALQWLSTLKEYLE